MRRILIAAALALLATLAIPGCVTPPEDKPVPPPSSSSRMPWNRPQPGEGQAQFGGMLQRR